jgi:hypothetical protein
VKITDISVDERAPISACTNTSNSPHDRPFKPFLPLPLHPLRRLKMFRKQLMAAGSGAQECAGGVLSVAMASTPPCSSTRGGESRLVSGDGGGGERE